MKTDIKKLPKSKIEIIAAVTGEELRPFAERTLNEFARQASIRGFRPGKAPKEIVEKEVGKIKIYEEAAIAAIKEHYPRIVEENKLEIIGEPKIEITKLVPGETMEFKVEASILPRVKLGDYKKVREKKNKIEVKEETIESELKDLQKSRAKLVTVKREAKKGDKAEINFTSRVGGVKLDGGESKNHPLVIGESKFVPGFEENLIGMKEGEEKKFSVVFPKDYHKKDLSEKPVEFEVKMVLVQERILPELNEEFVKGLGKFKDVSELKASIKQGLLLELEDKETQRVRLKVIEAVVSKSEMDIPEILVHFEVHKMLDELKINIEQMGLKFETYLKNIGKTEEGLEGELLPEAEKRVKMNLVLNEIAKAEKIEITEKEIEEDINKALASLGNIEEAKAKIDLPRLKEYTKGVLSNRKVFDLLEKIANK